LRLKTDFNTLLVNLPWSSGSRLGVRAGSRWPFTLEPGREGRLEYLPFPFFLAYAASLLKANGCRAVLLDAIAEGLDSPQLFERLQELDPGLAVMETSTPSFENDLAIAGEIRRRHPGVAVALCGPHASVFAREILRDKPAVDFVLLGEYEFTLLDLCRALRAGGELKKIPGLAYRQEGAVRVNQRRKTIHDLDELPWPERGDVPIYRYNDGFAGMPVPNVQMWSSRGCPFRCSYCLWPQTIYREHRYRKRGADKVAEEMQYLAENFKFQAIYFDDDIFNADRGHVLGICRQIQKRKIRIPWGAMARAELMDQELLRTMRAAGLFAVKYGIESANKQVLARCRKAMDLEKARGIIKATKDLGIRVHLTFCLGLPGETAASVEETAAFIRETRPDSLQCSLAVPFPGTELFASLKKKNQLLSGPWSDYDGSRRCVFRTEELSPEGLEELHRAFSHNFNL